MAVAEFYCDKPTGELQDLWAALEEEQDGPSVNYVRLFEEDRDLNQGTFATLLRQLAAASRTCCKVAAASLLQQLAAVATCCSSLRQ